MAALLFYTATISFSCGIFMRSFVPLGLPEIAFLSLLAFACAILWRRTSAANRTHAVRTVTANAMLVASIALFCIACGALRYEIANWYAREPLLEASVGSERTIEGVIDREPDVRESSTHLYVDIGTTHVLVTVDRFAEHRYGDHIRVRGIVERPESFTTDLGRTFNYHGYLLARDTSYLIRYGDVATVASGEGNQVVAALLSFKHAFMRGIEKLIVEPEVGLGEGLLLGEKRALGEELETVFRATGIIHIVVLSGYNIMLVVAFVMYLFAYVMGVRARAVCGVIAIVAFAVLVGLSATVVRASVMAGLLLFAQATGHTYAVMRALMLAGTVMLFLNPYLLAFDTGFQLSFLATMGLILVAPHVETRLRFVPTTFKMREFLVATIATQLFVLPLLLYQIGEFSVVAIAVNVLTLPMVPVAMFLTFVTGMLALVAAPLALPVAYLAEHSLAYILVLAQAFAMLPFASYAVPAFPFVMVPIAYACIGYGVWYLYAKKRITPPNLLETWTIVDEGELLGIRRP